MKVATILINYNDEENTINLAKELEQNEMISKIVIVDNLSEENSFNRLKEFERANKSEKIVVIKSDKNGGYNYGLNYGVHYIEKENYDYIMCSNTDIEISKEAIKECLENLEKNERTAVVAPRMLNKNGDSIRRCSWKFRTFKRDVIHSTRLMELLFYKELRAGEYSEKELKQDTLKVEAISGSCFFIKYKVLKEINYFDENTFLFYEEDMLGKRLAEKNYETYSINNVSFKHFESQSIGKSFSYYKKMVRLFKSKMYYQKKYNKINSFQILVFYILWIFRNIELIFEIPIRKILKK